MTCPRPAPGAWATPPEVTNDELARLAFEGALRAAPEPLTYRLLLQAGILAACPQVMLPWMLPEGEYSAWELATQPHRYEPRMTLEPPVRALRGLFRSGSARLDRAAGGWVPGPELLAAPGPAWMEGRAAAAVRAVLAMEQRRRASR
jgi:hypothetical protein